MRYSRAAHLAWISSDYFESLLLPQQRLNRPAVNAVQWRQKHEQHEAEQLNHKLQTEWSRERAGDFDLTGKCDWKRDRKCSTWRMRRRFPALGSLTVYSSCFQLFLFPVFTVKLHSYTVKYIFLNFSYFSYFFLWITRHRSESKRNENQSSEFLSEPTRWSSMSPWKKKTYQWLKTLLWCCCESDL